MTSEVPRHASPEPVEQVSGQAASGRRPVGTAHVPDAALLPAHHLPALPVPVPRVYGRPAPTPTAPGIASAAVPAPAAPPVPPQRTGQFPAEQPGGYATGPAHIVGPPHPLAVRQPGGSVPPDSPPVGWAAPPQAAPPQAAGPHPTAGGHGPGTGTVYPSSGPAPSAPPAAAPATNWATVTDDEMPRQENSGSHTGMLIAVGGVVLLAMVGLVAFLWPRGGGAEQFAVNTCVRQTAGTAEATDCTAAGAFMIVSRVEQAIQCPDPQQPFVQLSTGKNRILCLAPAGVKPPVSAVPNPTST